MAQSPTHRFGQIIGEAGWRLAHAVKAQRPEGPSKLMAERLKKDYSLYVVFDCASTPKLHAVQDPARLGWRPIVNVEDYAVNSADTLAAHVAQHQP